MADLAHPQEPGVPLRLPVAVRVLLAIALLGLIALLWRFRQNGIFVHPETLLQAVGKHTVVAMGLFLTLYAVTALAGIPTLPLNVVAGWFWGPLVGGALSAGGAAAGATLAFAAARTIFGQPLRRRFGGKFLTWVQDEFEQKGWRFIVFIRLNPAFPSGPLNYLFGLSSIRASTYIWSTAISLLPPSVVIAWFGSEIVRVRSGSDTGQIMRLMIVISAGVSIMAGIRYYSRYLNHVKREPKS